MHTSTTQKALLDPDYEAREKEERKLEYVNIRDQMLDVLRIHGHLRSYEVAELVGCSPQRAVMVAKEFKSYFRVWKDRERNGPDQRNHVTDIEIHPHLRSMAG